VHEDFVDAAADGSGADHAYVERTKGGSCNWHNSFLCGCSCSIGNRVMGIARYVVDVGIGIEDCRVVRFSVIVAIRIS